MKITYFPCVCACLILSPAAAIADKAPRKVVRAIDPGQCMPGPDSETIRGLVKGEASQQGVDVKLALAIVEAESSSGVNLNSERGARGPMQMIPETAFRYGVTNLCNPNENIRAGVSYLKDLSDEFNANVLLVAAAYNAGPERVYEARGVPAISETVRFVASVTNAYWGFGTHVSRKGGRVKTASAAIAPTDGAGKGAGGLTWIGGSVLYVEEGVKNDEK